ncbi:hypothetical protein NQ038_13620 [Brevibacterium sp. 50QC2O2]|uniref:hypothetical protein n=1 Tax=Brevibacterium TaxID=1696 RepID=UPI00211C66C0|nr:MULTISPECIES: hypothetical protein [unclassified Brevibacterium]MCQ9369357.1 hypothetical protein [Brevibacterium sp. 91QC2O2]MCQ9386513.1 hypothetical protein [Brevibacterium sp. 68QC2CO]MCQ9389676.1 hypothetical protein [Brevibacterium sp. 50QC2O2]
MSRRAKELSEEQRAVVRTVRRLARQRAVVNENYISSILQARAAGITYAAIAEAVGTSSQAVQEIVRRHARSEGFTSVQEMAAAPVPVAAAVAAEAPVAQPVAAVTARIPLISPVTI